MCRVSEWPKGRRAGDLPLAAFKRLIDEQYGLVEIKLQGLGEPTLQRDDFFAMIRYARQRHIWVRTTTNASLLHLDGNADKLLDSDVNEIQISIDGADAATYQAIRRRGRFDRVIANCRMLNERSTARGVVRTKMWVLVQKANRDQLGELVDLAAALGFRHLVFSLTLTDFGMAAWRTRADALTADDLTLSAAHALVTRGRNQGVRVGFWRVTEKYKTDAPAHLCPWPFERAMVSSDQRVVPCCYLGSPDVSDFGPADALTAIWHGETMTAFRQAHLAGDPPPLCRGCYADAS
jgi:pyrroloquinoline quinone biosynthesis protein E